MQCTVTESGFETIGQRIGAIERMSNPDTKPNGDTTTARRPRFNDYVALWLLQLAKLRRRELAEPTGQDYEKFYEEFFDEKDLELYVKDRRSTTRQETILEFLQAHVPAGAKILDVGCGLGEILGILPAGYQLHGMDYAQHNVAVSTKRLGARAVIKQGSIYDIPFASDQFDVCLCNEVLEHIEDDARGVRDIARVLKPGGFLLTAVPYTYYWPQYLKLMGHFRHYTQASFTQLLQDQGLTVQTTLRNYPHWHQAYTRRYSLIRAQGATFGRLLGCPGVFDFKWPWQRQPAMTRLRERLEPLWQQDRGLDYSKLDTSTFVMARKGGGA